MNPQPSRKTLFLSCQTRNCYGDGPRFAKVTLSEALVARILALNEVAKSNDLLGAIVEYPVDTWDGIMDFGIVEDTLVVRPEGFFWSAIARHADFVVETATLPITVLRDFLQSSDICLVYADGCSELGITTAVRESLMNEARLSRTQAPAVLDAISNCEDSTAAISQLLALLHVSSTQFSTPDCPDCLCVQDGHCLCIPSKPAAGASAL